MKSVIAPEIYNPGPRDRCIFLAGGITNAPQWQSELTDLLNKTELVIFNPRRPNYESYEGIAQEQIEWEFKKMRQADAISFWFPDPAPCVITMFELGNWSNIWNNKPIFVGVDPTFYRRQDIEVQMSLVRPELKIAHSLVELSLQIRQHFRETK